MMGGDARGRGQVSPDQSPGLHTQMARTASLMWKVQIHRCVGLGKVNSRDQILGGTIKMDKLWWILWWWKKFKEKMPYLISWKLFENIQGVPEKMVHSDF